MKETEPELPLSRTGQYVATRAAAALLMVTVTTAALVFIAPRELWLDETHSMHLSRLSLAKLLEYVRGDVHPPLYFLLLNLWQRIVGDSPVALRALGALAHIAGVFAFWFLCREIVRDNALALCGAALFLLSPALVYHAGDARMYSIAVLLAVVLLQCVTRFLRQDRSISTAIEIAIFAALAFYTHYALLFFVAGTFAFLFVQSLQNTPRLKHVLLSGTVFAFLTLPWLPVMLAQRARKIGQGVEIQASRLNPDALTFGGGSSQARGIWSFATQRVEDIASLTGIFPSDSTLIMALFAIPILVALLCCVLEIWREERTTPLLLAILTAFSVAGTFVLGLPARRYLLWLAPLAILAMLVGAQHLQHRVASSRWMYLLVGGLLCIYLAGAVRVVRRPKPRPFQIAVDFLKQNSHPDDRLVISALYAQVPFDYYASRANLAMKSRGFPRDIYDWWESQEFKGWGGPIIFRKDVERVQSQMSELQPGSIFWLIEFEEDYYDPRHLLLASLRNDNRWSVRRCLLPADVGVQLALYAITRPDSNRLIADCPSQ